MITQDTPKLHTEESKNLSEDTWSVYPRPQMKRASFLSLNGSWSFSANGEEWESITVPFPPESTISGIGRQLGKNAIIRYKKTFTLPN